MSDRNGRKVLARRRSQGQKALVLLRGKEGHCMWPFFFIFTIGMICYGQVCAAKMRIRIFRRIYAKGKSYVSSSVITYVSKNRCKQIRLVLLLAKIGNAVQRNRGP